MVVICPVSLDCTGYMLEVFATEVSHLIGTCTYSLFKTVDMTVNTAGQDCQNEIEEVFRM